jgi:hypothetical protein
MKFSALVLNLSNIFKFGYFFLKVMFNYFAQSMNKIKTNLFFSKIKMLNPNYSYKNEVNFFTGGNCMNMRWIEGLHSGNPDLGQLNFARPVRLDRRAGQTDRGYQNFS